MSNDSQVFNAMLKTKGRVSGNEHSVWLRAVMYENKIYFSRTNPDGDWLKNALKNSDVKVEFDNKKFSGKAQLVDDKNLERRISNLKYSDKRKEISRIVLQVTIK